MDFQSKPEVGEPYGAMKKDSYEIDPMKASCYGLQKSHLEKKRSHRRGWLLKKRTAVKLPKEFKSDGQPTVDDLLNSIVTVGISASSSTSGSQASDLTTKSNGNSSESTLEPTPIFDFAEGSAVDKEEKPTMLLAQQYLSAVPGSIISPPDHNLSPNKNDMPIIKEVCTKLPNPIYCDENSEGTSMHSKISSFIPDNNSVHSMDTLSTITLDPVLELPLPLQKDDHVENTSPHSSSIRRQRTCKNVPRLPILQAFGNSSFSFELSMLTNTPIVQNFHQEEKVRSSMRQNSEYDQSPNAMKEKAAAYISTTEATKVSRKSSEKPKKPLIITTSPKKSPTTLDQNKIKKNNRRKLRSYQCEPSISKVADAHLVEI